MKSENSNGKMLLGLGLGALLGVAIGYYMTPEHRRRLEEDLHEVGHGIKDGVKSTFSKVKSKAEQAGSRMAEKAGEWSDKADEKANEWADKAGEKSHEWANRAAGAADDFSQKANNMQDKLDNRSEENSKTSSQYAQNAWKDVNDIKNKNNGEK